MKMRSSHIILFVVLVVAAYFTDFSKGYLNSVNKRKRTEQVCIDIGRRGPSTF